MLHGRRLRPALARRLRRRMRAHRQGGAPSGQADLDARGGHRPRHVPPAVVPVPGGGDGRVRQGDGLEALRRRRRRIPPHHRHQDSVLRGAEPAHRTARRLPRHQAQALARRGPRVQHLRHREPRRPDGGRPGRRSDRIPLRAHGRHAQGAQGVRGAGADVRLQGEAAGRPRLGISITERSGSLGAGAVEISLDRATGKIRVHKVWIGDRRRRDRAAGRGQGQCGERDHLRPVQHRCTSA